MPSAKNDSPSASSILSPTGLRSHQPSKSSLTLALEPDELSEALNNIHSAASQSQDLTIFNDYTEPPSSVKDLEDKGLVGDLQGGLTGLYNKFKATVGGAKDHTVTSEGLISDGSQPDRILTQPLSGRTSRIQSRVQSPRLPPSEAPLSPDVSSNPSRSSKTPNVTRVSGGSTPSLKSPTGLLKTPAFNIDLATVASSNARSHSQHASMSSDELANQDKSLSYLVDEQNGHKKLSRNDSEARLPWKVPSPQLATPAADTRIPTVVPDRGVSDVSIPLTSSASRHNTVSPMISVSNNSFNLKSRPSTTNPAGPTTRKPGVNPVQLLAEHNSRSKSPVDQLLSPPLSLSEKPPNRLVSRVSQSRLPGFSTSRASSTDSGITRVPTADARASKESPVDGAAEDLVPEVIHRPSSRLKSKLISKEFWMRDENARDCFRCGEPFSTFRRKHHCRVCGQIFDNKCTTLISGSFFGQSSAIRVCKPCEIMVTSNDDDSSDYSIDDIAPSEIGGLPQTPDLPATTPRLEDDNISVMSQPFDHVAKTPTMSFPVRKAYDDNGGSSEVFEFDTIDRPLPRPSSSRSLKTSHSIVHGHKRHHSRHQHTRSFKSYHDERAPFQKRNPDTPKGFKKSAFHRDSIIDPDLAQYLSDDASSGDEQSVQTETQQDKLSRSGPDSDRLTIGGLLAAVRKGRSRMGDRSIAGFLNITKDSDDAASIISARAIDGPRFSRKRNLSTASSGQNRLTPKGTRERLQIVVPNMDNDSAPSPLLNQMRSRMIRSASMHGAGAPTLELNCASVNHVQKLLRQLLTDADVPKVASWEDALTPILLRATDDVDPDVHGGDDIDVRNYVKLKKIPGGRPHDTSYISGLVFTKNVALKSMPRSIFNPQILIITFPLEYARHEQHFMSLDPVIRQEREFLENTVGRIAALRPDLLLAQQNISGLALELLEAARITTVYNVKSSVLEAVSRCTQTRVAYSLDKLGAMKNQLGSCDSFEVKTFVAEGRKKTYIYLSGCAPSLGCTIALRGADRKTLSKIKRITDFMVYVVYNLKLETCLMRDEWALIPMQSSDSSTNTKNGSMPCIEKNRKLSALRSAEDPPVPSIETVTNRSEASVHDEKATTEKDAQMRSTTRINSNDPGDIPDDVPVPTLYEDLVENHQTKIISASPFVKFAPPYLLMRARELERRVAYLKRLRDQDMSSSEISTDEKAKSHKFMLIQPDMVHTPLAGTSSKVREIIRAVHDAEFDRAFHNYETQKKQWETYLSGNQNLFDPYAHQNIVVLFSQVSTETSVPCSGPDLLAFSFYNEHENDEKFEADCTLGQFVEDLCYRANEICPSDACEKKLYEHHRQYVHGEAQISVFLQPYPAKMRGLQDIILMWSQCRICGVETTVTHMSTSTWKYSFGKYLELSFWSADLHARADVCPHDLHRDHFRFFGYKDFALRIHYDPIELLEIIVPRMRLTWKVDNDLRFRNDSFTRIENRITRFMVSVKIRLKSINAEAVLPEKADACRAEIETLTKRANEDHTMLIKQLQERYTNSHHWEIIPLNRAIRMMQEKVADWDNAFADFEKNYFPSEKDIRRLATIQLKKIFLDRDVSVTTFSSTDENTASPVATEDSKFEDEKAESPRRPELSREKTQSVLQSVLEEHASPDSKSPPQGLTKDPEKQTPLALPEVPGGHHNTDDVRHLDLAVPEPEKQSATTPQLPSTNLEVTSTPRRAATPVQDDEAAVTTPKASQLDLSLTESLKTTQSSESPDSPRTPHAELPKHSIRRTDSGKVKSPTLTRAQSQPSTSFVTHGAATANSTTPTPLSVLTATGGFGYGGNKHASTTRIDTTQDLSEDKSTDRSRFSTLKYKLVKGQSFIPRAISSRKESRVSNLAKHFEQLSREFERERVRERKLRAAKNRQSRVYPLAAPKPIVEVYRDVNEAVDENDPSESLFDRIDTTHAAEAAPDTAQGIADTNPADTKGDGFHAPETPAELTENDTEVHQSSHAPSDAEDHDSDDESDEIQLPDSPEDLLRLSQEDLDLKELPKHERTSLMKMLTNFWAERSSSGWSNLEYPLSASDHIFADCDIIVREDEPSSIIAFALDSQDYNEMLHEIQDHQLPPEGHQAGGAGNSQVQTDVMHSLLRKTGSHLRYQFEEGPAKMLCKIFFAEQFDAMRRKCGVADRFVESMSRCLKWDSKGGKTKSLFLKTLDDRFVLKSLSTVETQSFLKFAPNYFQIMSEAFFNELPSVIAKMFGFYQIIIKNPVTNVEYNWFLLVMENLFYDRVPTRIFDLKGSMRNRKINATGERNEVLLDENMVEFIYESPLFSREHSKKLLRSSVHNDTLFLARQDVMDYSLMIAIEESRKELVVGIIDCIRTYTWDKKLESWIKDRGFAGGGKNRPTVTSPKEYKRRFREAMNRYVLEAPSPWHPVRGMRNERRSLGNVVDGGENEVPTMG